MEPTLTPALALDYLHELSTDVRAGVVLDDRGRRLAGSTELAAVALDLKAASTGAAAVEVRTAAGAVYLTASSSHVLVVVAGPFALASLLLHDMTAVLALLRGAAADAAPELDATARGAVIPHAAPVAVRWAAPGGPLGPVDPGDARHAAVVTPGSALLAVAGAT